MLKSILYIVKILKVVPNRLKQHLNQEFEKSCINVYQRFCENM